MLTANYELPEPVAPLHTQSPRGPCSACDTYARVQIEKVDEISSVVLTSSPFKNVVRLRCLSPQ